MLYHGVSREPPHVVGHQRGKLNKNIKMEVPVLMTSLKSCILNLISSKMDKTLCGVVSAALRKWGPWGVHGALPASVG